MAADELTDPIDSDRARSPAPLPMSHHDLICLVGPVAVCDADWEWSQEKTVI